MEWGAYWVVINIPKRNVFCFKRKYNVRKKLWDILYIIKTCQSFRRRVEVIAAEWGVLTLSEGEWNHVVRYGNQCLVVLLSKSAQVACFCGNAEIWYNFFPRSVLVQNKNEWRCSVPLYIFTSKLDVSLCCISTVSLASLEIMAHSFRRITRSDILQFAPTGRA